jgi:hypothetical protein
MSSINLAGAGTIAVLGYAASAATPVDVFPLDPAIVRTLAARGISNRNERVRATDLWTALLFTRSVRPDSR